MFKSAIPPLANALNKFSVEADLSYAINERALLHLDNAYYLSDLEVKNYLCKTNTSSSTAFRGFGGNQGMMIIENIIDNVAKYLMKDSAEIRKINFYQKNRKNITHYGMKIEDNVINEIFSKLIKSSNYKNRRLNIKKFFEDRDYYLNDTNFILNSIPPIENGDIILNNLTAEILKFKIF